MSIDRRFDPLGLSELDSRLAAETADLAFEPTLASGSQCDEMPGARATLPGRLESRRAFVQMKQLFMGAVENLAHHKGAWLRAQVRAAEDPVDLWLLRSPLLSALREDDLATRTLRAALYRSLDLAFPAGLLGAAYRRPVIHPRA